MNADALLDHFNRLINQPDAVPRVRRFILDLAIRGKLVEQDPSNASASELLKEIRLEQERLSSVPTKHNSQSTIGVNGVPFALPSLWNWASLGQILQGFLYGPPFGVDEYTTTGVPTIRTTDMTDDGRIVLRDPPKVTVPPDRLDNWKCKRGDLLITRTGSIGTMAIFDADYPAIASAYLIRLRFAKAINVSYVHIALRSPYGQAELGLGTTKVAQPNINVKSLAAILVPIPPLAEQHRIVAKVDELMALCDRLEAQLAITQAESRRLLDAALHEALVPNEN
jgi:hypothetical protein